MPGTGSGNPIDDLIRGLGPFAVPALLAGLPFLIVFAIIGLQLIAGAAWLPFVRRYLGGFGLPWRHPDPPVLATDPEAIPTKSH